MESFVSVPARRLSITEMALQGLSQREIAKAVGLTQARVSQILASDAELRAQINEGQKAQVILLPLAIKRHAELLESDDEKVAMQAIKLTYDTTGIAPTHAQSILVQNLFVNQTNVIQDAQFRSMALQFLGFDSPTIHDAEIIPESKDVDKA